MPKFLWQLLIIALKDIVIECLVEDKNLSISVSLIHFPCWVKSEEQYLDSVTVSTESKDTIPNIWYCSLVRQAEVIELNIMDAIKSNDISFWFFMLLFFMDSGYIPDLIQKSVKKNSNGKLSNEI